MRKHKSQIYINNDFVLLLLIFEINYCIFIIILHNVKYTITDHIFKCMYYL